MMPSEMYLLAESFMTGILRKNYHRVLTLALRMQRRWASERNPPPPYSREFMSQNLGVSKNEDVIIDGGEVGSFNERSNPVVVHGGLLFEKDESVAPILLHNFTNDKACEMCGGYYSQKTLRTVLVPTRIDGAGIWVCSGCWFENLTMETQQDIML
jgi:hypothetical protein